MSHFSLVGAIAGALGGLASFLLPDWAVIALVVIACIVLVSGF